MNGRMVVGYWYGNVYVLECVDVRVCMDARCVVIEVGGYLVRRCFVYAAQVCE